MHNLNNSYPRVKFLSPVARELFERIPRGGTTVENEDIFAHWLGVSRRQIRNAKNELEEAGLIDIHYLGNGKRRNPAHKIVNVLHSKRTLIKHIREATSFFSFTKFDRASLIENYILSKWDVVPFEPRGKRPLANLSYRNWKLKSDGQKIDYFLSNPTLNLGLVVPDYFTVIDCDSIETANNFCAKFENFKNTLTVRTARGFQFYFQADEVLKTSVKVLPDTDIRCAGSYGVLPPSVHPSGISYKWSNVALPENLPVEFRREWRRNYFQCQGAEEKFSLPSQIPKGTRNDVLFRFGRSLRAKGKNSFEIADELSEVNKFRCQPPLAGGELEKLIRHIWEHPDRFLR